MKLKGKTPQLLNDGAEIIVPVEDQGKLTQLKIIFHFTQNLQKSSNLSITQAKSSTNQSSSGGNYYDPTRAPTTAPSQDYSSIPVVRRVNAVYYDPDDPSNTSNSFILIKKQLTVPPNAFRPDSGLDLSMIYKLEKSEFWHIMVAFVLLFVTIYHTYINLMGIMALINYISSGAPYVTWQMAFIDTIPMALIFCFSFLIHELSHLETGRHYKFQSRFCLTNVGVKTTLKSAIIGLPFALPGAAVSVGVDPEKDKDKMGAIKIAGPLSNLIFGIVLISIAYFLPTDFARVKNILVQGSSLNFVLGAFNMIPAEFKGFALDGKYIRTWKFTYYLILLILLIGSYVGSIILSQDYQKLMTA